MGIFASGLSLYRSAVIDAGDLLRCDLIFSGDFLFTYNFLQISLEKGFIALFFDHWFILFNQSVNTAK
jgi:hypothetical protein